MNHDQDSASAVLMKLLGLAVVWMASVKLADIQLMVSIVSGLALCVYSVLKTVALWRRDFKTQPKDDDDDSD